MIKSQNLYIKKRNFPEALTVFVFVMPFLLPTLLQLFSLPGIVKYTIDVAWVVGFLIMFFRKNIKIPKELIPHIAVVSAYFLFAFIAYLFNYQSIIYFLWGTRNNFRFYVVFLMFVFFFEKDDIESIFKVLDALFWINAAVVFVQYFVMGHKHDNLGGIFGVEMGSNASLLIFMSIMVTKTVLNYMNGQKRTVSCIAICGVSLIIAALAELKMFFVICVMIIVLAAVLTKFSWRKVVLVCGVLFLVSAIGSLLPILFGEGSNITMARIIELATAKNYSSARDLGRFTAIQTLSKTILQTLPERLFGLGLGNCDTSTFAICNTPFFKNYEYLNYTWFSTSFTFLETGYVGLILNTGFFAVCICYTLRNIKRNIGESSINQLSLIVAVLCYVIFVYNSSLRTEAGYIIYFILALPCIYSKANGAVADTQAHLTNL